MSKPDKMSAKRQRFVQEYPKDMNGTQAAIRSGYSPKTAGVIAHEILNIPNVAAAVAKAQEERAARVEVTQDYVLTRLVENLERSMQLVAVTDKRGNPTGEYTYQGTVANGALALLGKHMGMFIERTMDVTELSRDERKERLLKLIG